MVEGWTSNLGTWAEAGLSFLYPAVCQFCACRRAEAAQGYVCDQCRRKVRVIEPPFCGVCGKPFAGEMAEGFRCGSCAGLELHFDWARSAVVASGLVLEAVRRYKYRRQLWLENFLAALLLEAAGPVLRAGDWDCIVPVPLHPLKEREREFNQAERLARRLGRATGLPLEHRWLRRIKATRTQTHLSRVERVVNVSRAFAWRGPISLRGRRCLLVDDVLTTGSTTSECARVLRAAGAARVAVWTVARRV
jgi:competence protein ComFC